MVDLILAVIILIGCLAIVICCTNINLTYQKAFHKQLMNEMDRVAKEYTSSLMDELKVINKQISFNEQLQKKMTELICYKIKKLEISTAEVKTGIDKVADNVNDITLNTKNINEQLTEAEEDEKYITYEDMVRDFQYNKQIDYMHQISRLQKQIEIIEYNLEERLKENKQLKDENLRLKAGLEVKEKEDEARIIIEQEETEDLVSQVSSAESIDEVVVVTGSVSEEVEVETQITEVIDNEQENKQESDQEI